MALEFSLIAISAPGHSVGFDVAHQLYRDIQYIGHKRQREQLAFRDRVLEFAFDETDGYHPAAVLSISKEVCLLYRYPSCGAEFVGQLLDALQFVFTEPSTISVYTFG